MNYYLYYYHGYEGKYLVSKYKRTKKECHCGCGGIDIYLGTFSDVEGLDKILRDIYTQEFMSTTSSETLKEYPDLKDKYIECCVDADCGNIYNYIEMMDKENLKDIIVQD